MARGVAFVAITLCAACKSSGPATRIVVADIAYPTQFAGLYSEVGVEGALFKSATTTSSEMVGKAVVPEVNAVGTQFRFTFPDVEEGTYHLAIAFLTTADVGKSAALVARPRLQVGACAPDAAVRAVDYCAAARLWDHCPEVLAQACGWEWRSVASGGDDTTHSANPADLLRAPAKPELAVKTHSVEHCEEQLWGYIQAECEANGVAAECQAAVTKECSESAAPTTTTDAPVSGTSSKSVHLLATLLAQVEFVDTDEFRLSFTPQQFNLAYDDDDDGVLNLDEAVALDMSSASPSLAPAVGSMAPSAAPTPVSPSVAVATGTPAPTAPVAPPAPAPAAPAPAPPVAPAPAPTPPPSPAPVDGNDDPAPAPAKPALVWTLRESPLPTELSTIALGADRFVAMSRYGGILGSEDGQTWTLQSEESASGWNVRLAYGSGYFVRASPSITDTSTDGLEWTPGGPVGISVLSMAMGPNQVVAIGGSGKSAVSTDAGKTWSPGESGTIYGLHGAAYGNGRFVVVGDYGTVLTSEDGAEWVTQEIATTKHLQSVGFGADRFVVYESADKIWTSTDGESWTAQAPKVTTASGASVSFSPTYMCPLRFLNDRFAVGGYSGKVYRSPDGVNWEQTSIPTDAWINDIAFGHNAYVAVGDFGTIATAPAPVAE